MLVKNNRTDAAAIVICEKILNMVHTQESRWGLIRMLRMLTFRVAVDDHLPYSALRGFQVDIYRLLSEKVSHELLIAVCSKTNDLSLGDKLVIGGT